MRVRLNYCGEIVQSIDHKLPVKGLKKCFVAKKIVLALLVQVGLAEELRTRAAVIRYSGTWNKSNYGKDLVKLQDWMSSQRLTPRASPVWARYNSQISIPMFRRNEVIIPLKDDGQVAVKKD